VRRALLLLVQGIIDNGMAYESNGSVYFDTAKFRCVNVCMQLDAMPQGISVAGECSHMHSRSGQVVPAGGCNQAAQVLC